MARKYRTHITEKKAVEFTLKTEGLEAYKEAWLILCNNAREYPETLYKVYNCAGSNIYVIANPDSADKTKEWLSQFGEITNVDNDKVAVFVDVSCDYSNFDEDYIDSDYIFGELD